MAQSLVHCLDINVLKVNIINVMDVNNRNILFSKGEIDRDDLWPKITEYRDQPCTFRFSFGLDELPTEAGIILIRGPRHFGKSTWLELKMLTFGCAFFPSSGVLQSAVSAIASHNTIFQKMELPIPFYGTKVGLSSQSRYLAEYAELSFIARKIAIVLFVA